MTTQEAIKALRKRGYSKRRIARELGIHRNTVDNYLGGGRAPEESKCTISTPGIDDPEQAGSGPEGSKCTISTPGSKRAESSGGSGRLSECESFREISHAKKGHLLIRARANIKSSVLEALKDGSALVTVNLRRQSGGKHECGKIQLREIRGRVRKPKQRQWSEIRLWTTLFDSKRYPAQELLALYAQRWEEEIFIKEMKIELRDGDVLQSYTPETAAQEIIAMLLACSMLAKQRMEVAESGQLHVLRISFVKLLAKVRSLWVVLSAGSDVFDQGQIAHVVKNTQESILEQATPPRRSRSSPRAVRQPVTGWPRLIKNRSIEGDFTLETLRIS